MATLEDQVNFKLLTEAVGLLKERLTPPLPTDPWQKRVREFLKKVGVR